MEYEDTCGLSFINIPYYCVFTFLEVENLIKNYGSFRAVDGISFSIPEGKVIGLLGPNGAGKTTTIHVLLGITLFNGGFIK